MSWNEHVHPHGPLQEIAPGLWQVQGTLPKSPLPRNMAIWRLTTGGLCIHSGVACDDETMRQIEALGPVELLIVPNGMHRADAAVYKARYPTARVVAPEGAQAKVEAIVAVDALASDALPPLGTEVLHVAGIKPVEHVYRVPLDGEGHALVMTDLLFNQPHLPGFMGWILRWVTRSTGRFGMTPPARLMMLTDRSALASWLRQQADAQGLAAICVGHGDPITNQCADRLHEAADAL